MSRRVLVVALAIASSALWAPGRPAADTVPPSSSSPHASPVVAPTATAPGVPPSSDPARPGPPVAARRLTAEERALLDVQEQGRRRVTELVTAARSISEGPARRALERKVEEIKKESRVEFLRVKVRFALERGDLVAARDAEQRIELILNPPGPPAVAPTAREKAPRGEGTRP